MNLLTRLALLIIKKQRDAFYNRNVVRDTHMDFSEYKNIPGLQNINLVKLGSYEPCCFGKCAHVFYTIIMLAQFYKLYVNSFCVYQPFKIRKIVSSRYNLMAQVKKNEKYKVVAPIINLGSETYKYDSEEIGRVYDAAKPVCPTEEELKNARQYENSVPDFEMKEGDNSSAPPRQSSKRCLMKHHPYLRLVIVLLLEWMTLLQLQQRIDFYLMIAIMIFN